MAFDLSEREDAAGLEDRFKKFATSAESSTHSAHLSFEHGR